MSSPLGVQSSRLGFASDHLKYRPTIQVLCPRFTEADYHITTAISLDESGRTPFHPTSPLTAPNTSSPVSQLDNPAIQSLYEEVWDRGSPNSDKLQLLLSQANRGQVLAQAHLSHLYYWGHGGLPQDLHLAQQYAQLARSHIEDQAVGGDMYAQAALARMYRYGVGVSVNPFKAFHWYQEAARQDLPAAQDGLGQMYFEGQGVPKNLKEAERWFIQAMNRGHIYAKISLADLYEDRDREGDQQKAFEIYEELAPIIPFAKLRLAMHLIDPDTVQDCSRGLRILEELGHSDDVRAMLMLGLIYSNGQDLTSQYKTVGWLKKAAKKGNKTAMGFLSHIYRKGLLHVMADPTTAADWQNRALENLDTLTAENLAELHRISDMELADPEEAAFWEQKARELAGDLSANENPVEIDPVEDKPIRELPLKETSTLPLLQGDQMEADSKGTRRLDVLEAQLQQALDQIGHLRSEIRNLGPLEAQVAHLQQIIDLLKSAGSTPPPDPLFQLQSQVVHRHGLGKIDPSTTRFQDPQNKAPNEEYKTPAPDRTPGQQHFQTYVRSHPNLQIGRWVSLVENRYDTIQDFPTYEEACRAHRGRGAWFCMEYTGSVKPVASVNFLTTAQFGDGQRANGKMKIGHHSSLAYIDVEVSRPILEGELYFEGLRKPPQFQGRMMLDTGATVSLVPENVVKSMQLTQNGDGEAVGLGGTANLIYYDAKIEVGDLGSMDLQIAHPVTPKEGESWILGQSFLGIGLVDEKLVSEVPEDEQLPAVLEDDVLLPAVP